MWTSCNVVILSIAVSANAAVADLGAVLEPIRAKTGVPALGAAIVQGDHLVGAGVCGTRDVGSTVKAEVSDAFHIGSCTKAMTATLAAMLVQDGTLRWDLTVAVALPKLRDGMRKEYRSATLRQLLTHRAGIPPYTEIGDGDLKQILALPGRPIDQRRAFAARVLAEAPVHPPGQGEEYSNAGYTIAAAIMEEATGKSWEDLMRHRLFGPLGMTTAGFGWPATLKDRDRLRGHTVVGSVISASRLDASYRLGPCLAPGGDVHCSVQDLARFAAFHLSRGRSAPRLLKPEAFDLLHAEPTGAKTGYAMGWPLVKAGNDEVAMMHDGTAGTFFCRLVLFPARNRAAIVSANAGEPAGKKACEQALGPALRASLGPSNSSATEKK
jgi:CubicO group peptidase (beta-lactamase class C family)